MLLVTMSCCQGSQFPLFRGLRHPPPAPHSGVSVPPPLLRGFTPLFSGAQPPALLSAVSFPDSVSPERTGCVRKCVTVRNERMVTAALMATAAVQCSLQVGRARKACNSLRSCLGTHSAWARTLPGHALCLGTHSAWAHTLPGHALCLGTHSAWAHTVFEGPRLFPSQCWTDAEMTGTDFVECYSGCGSCVTTGVGASVKCVSAGVGAV